MKKAFFTTVFALMLTLGGFAQGINFEKGSFASILEKAEKTNKLIFMDIYAEWCGPCKYMAAKVFTDKQVGEHFNAKYINAKFDAEKGEGITLARRYGVRAYPTFVLLNSKGEKVGEMIGGSPAKEFIQKIDELAAKVH